MLVSELCLIRSEYYCVELSLHQTLCVGLKPLQTKCILVNGTGGVCMCDGKDYAFWLIDCRVLWRAIYYNSECSTAMVFEIQTLTNLIQEE